MSEALCPNPPCTNFPSCGCSAPPMTSPELLPCPFCGTWPIENRFDYYTIGCDSDDCSMNPSVSLSIKIKDCENEVRTRWNTRAPSTVGVEALEACREFLVGMTKPVTATALSISSYHPCQALVDKIDAALASEKEGGKAEPTAEQLANLESGIGCLLPAKEAFLLGWRSALAAPASLIAKGEGK